MDEVFKNLQKNGQRFQQSLDRIAEKYSKIQQYGGDAVEVDLDNTHIGTLQHYMTLSKKNVNTFSKGFADVKEESLSLEDITKESMANYTCKERTDCFETTTLSENNDTVPTSHTVSILDENQSNYTVMSDQPEDEDEQLEMSLRRQGSSLGELYPDMINQIRNAWRRQHVSEVSDSVLKKYRKWRKSNRMQFANSFHIAQRPNNRKGTRQRDIFNKQHYNPKSPVKGPSSTMIKAGSMSPVKMVTNQQNVQYYYSRMKRRETPATAIVMDMSALNEEQEINKTFTVCEPTLRYSTYTSSPSRSFYSPKRLSQDLSFRMEESCMSPRHMQTTNCSGFAAGNSLLKESHETYSSPVRQSPYKSRLVSRNSFSEQTHIYGSHMKRRETPATKIVMDMSALSEEHEINKTFTVCEPTLRYSTYTSSPSRSFYSPKRLSQDLSFRMEESCMSPRHMQTTNCSGFAAGNSLLKESHETYSSPVRQSPYKSRSVSRNSFSEQTHIYGSPVRKSPFRLHTSRESPQQSPYAAISKSPYTKQSLSRERSGFSSASNFVPSISPKIRVPRRTLEYSDLQLSPQPSSPQMGKSRRHQRLTRHLSFDSSYPTSSCASYTTTDFDNDFVKMYHKLVCLNKSSHIQGHPCRFCAKDPEASRGHSFSNLAALALSPHRPLLRKRHRDLDFYPQSKRFKDGSA